MKSKKPQKRKKHTLLWIVLILAGLLAGAFGLYTQLGLNRPAPVPMPVIARVKIPPMPPAPASMSTVQPSSRPENVQSANMPPAGEAGRDAVAPPGATGSSPNIPPSEPVQAATESGQKAAGRVDPDNRPPLPGVSPADPEQSAARTSIASAPIDNRPSDASPSDNQSPADAQDHPTAVSPASDDRPAADPVAPRPSPAQKMESESDPSASPDGSNPQADAKPPAPFSVQVGAFLTKANADQMAARLTAKGYDAYISRRTDKKQRVWHLVRFGRFQNRQAAAQAMKAFKDQEHMDASLAHSNTI